MVYRDNYRRGAVALSCWLERIFLGNSGPTCLGCCLGVSFCCKKMSGGCPGAVFPGEVFGGEKAYGNFQRTICPGENVWRWLTDIHIHRQTNRQLLNGYTISSAS